MADFGYARFGDDENEEEEDEAGFQATFNQRDGLIFLVDASKAMFKENTNDNADFHCLFQLCIKVAKTTMQNKIISSERDLIGTVFFGSEKSENPSGFKNVFVYQNLDEPDASRILKLEDIEENGIETFEETYGHNEGYSIRDALWTCQNLFATCKHNLGSRRVMLFTNNHDPHVNSPQLRRAAFTKANDLNETGIYLELMHLQNQGDTFDISRFYRDLLYDDEDEINEVTDPAERMEELLRRVRAKEHKKRANRTIPFVLGDGLCLSVGIYNMVRSCPKPSAVRLTKKDNAELKSNSKVYLPDTGEVLMPQDMKKAQTYGGRRICFENDEVTQMKAIDPPGMTLMGFKPRSALKKYFHVKPASFIYPDERKIVGSTQAFSALLKKCLERDVTPICKYTPSRNSPPSFVTLLPQGEELDQHKVQLTPPGFHLIHLPTADDFRKVKYDDAPRASTEQIDMAKEVIKKLKFRFNSEDFENPVLQKHWRNIEALALERDTVEDIEDHTMPSEEQFEKRAGSALTNFKEIVFPHGYVPGGGAKKRAAPSVSTADKKAKLDALDAGAEARAGRLGKLTVAILKDIIKKEAIHTTASRKNDLIDAINSHYGL